MKILITGGSGDIAKAIVKKLKESFSDIDIYAPSRLELDVIDLEACRKYVEDVKPDILINNAGYIKVNNLIDDDIESDLMALNVNLSSVFNLSTAAIKSNKDCFLINIGSSAGTKARGGWTSYCASKAGIIMATKCWADEDIKTVCLSPGRTVSKMREMLFPNEDQSGLLLAEKFAEVVILAINGKFENGINVDVNINNVEDLIRE